MEKITLANLPEELLFDIFEYSGLSEFCVLIRLSKRFSAIWRKFEVIRLPKYLAHIPILLLKDKSREYFRSIMRYAIDTKNETFFTNMITSELNPGTEILYYSMRKGEKNIISHIVGAFTESGSIIAERTLVLYCMFTGIVDMIKQYSVKKLNFGSLISGIATESLLYIDTAIPDNVYLELSYSVNKNDNFALMKMFTESLWISADEDEIIESISQTENFALYSIHRMSMMIFFSSNTLAYIRMLKYILLLGKQYPVYSNNIMETLVHQIINVFDIYRTRGNFEIIDVIVRLHTHFDKINKDSIGESCPNSRIIHEYVTRFNPKYAANESKTLKYIYEISDSARSNICLKLSAEQMTEIFPEEYTPEHVAEIYPEMLRKYANYSYLSYTIQHFPDTVLYMGMLKDISIIPDITRCRLFDDWISAEIIYSVMKSQPNTIFYPFLCGERMKKAVKSGEIDPQNIKTDTYNVINDFAAESLIPSGGYGSAIDDPKNRNDVRGFIDFITIYLLDIEVVIDMFAKKNRGINGSTESFFIRFNKLRDMAHQ